MFSFKCKHAGFLPNRFIYLICKKEYFIVVLSYVVSMKCAIQAKIIIYIIKYVV